MNQYLTTKQAEYLVNKGGGGGGSVDPYTSNPEMDGTASPGSSSKYARGDHVHPADTGRAAAAHSHGDITSGGDITATTTIASGDRIVINDESAGKITNSGITFGTSTTQYLANDGSWQSVPSVPSAATATPLVDGTAAVGSSAKYAKEDHVHPTDTSRAAATTVAASATISSSGLITFKNSGGTSLFTLQLPLYNGGMS